MQVKANNKMGSCGCGRSPTGQCVGWHGLSEDVYRERLAQYEAVEAAKKDRPAYVPNGAGMGGQ
jgi:homogentisate 1,2-dioxygenase